MGEIPSVLPDLFSLSFLSTPTMLPTDSSNPDRDLTVLTFQVGQHRCALSTERVAEILLLAALDRPKGMPRAYEGYLNLSGVRIPVVRLDRLLQVPDIPLLLSTPMIVLKGLSSPIALLAEKMVGVRRVSTTALSPVSAGKEFNECIQAVFQDGEVTTALLSDRIGEIAQEARMAA